MGADLGPYSPITPPPLFDDAGKITPPRAEEYLAAVLMAAQAKEITSAYAYSASASARYRAPHHQPDGNGGPVGQGRQVVVADFITDQRASHRVPRAVSCRALEVSQSSSTGGWDARRLPRDERRAENTLAGRMQRHR
ncbi:hypothetical protein [Streptomyces violascens]|uniref:hypothetical protein n=1 Tax=Streptomyces violascens TaxID=67381 RepID=UPI0016720BF6|nr:hypothetical protein [Streptomyces violascens]